MIFRVIIKLTVNNQVKRNLKIIIIIKVKAKI